MLGFLKEWWPIIGFVLAVAVIPFARWCIGQIRKGLASHDDLLAAREAAASAQKQLEERVNGRLEDHARWVADHNVLHAELAAQLRAMPTAEQLGQVLLGVKDLEKLVVKGLADQAGDLRAMKATMDSIVKGVEALDERVMRHEGIFADAGRRVS